MFLKTVKIFNSSKSLGGKSFANNYFYITNATATKLYHTTAKLQNYVETAPLPLPTNVDAAETTRFSPQRSRDISGTMALAQAPLSTIDITADNTMSAIADAKSGYNQDLHVQSYDCFGAVSLNCVMQSNVPSPFGGMHKFTHLNMPGGQWSQEYKFTSQNLHNSHYCTLRDSVRASWDVYYENATLQNPNRRYYCTAGSKSNQKGLKSTASIKGTTPSLQADTKKAKLKKAFKDYGATIVGFHVAISLISLGGFYLLVSGGINMVSLLENLGITSTAIIEKVATGSTFVVAYAVHKVFAPVRISITLGSAPFIVRYLRSKGFLKAKSKTI